MSRSVEALFAQRETLSEDEYAALETTFLEKVNAKKADAKVLRDDLDAKASAALQTLRDKVLEISHAIAKEEGYNAVFAQQNVVLVDKSINITDQVMLQLNEELTNLTLAE